MKPVGKIVLLSVLLLSALACRAILSQPTLPPTPTATSLPTLTASPTTPTAEPVQSPAPPDETPFIPGFSTPSGAPAAEWEGIPVMPGALAGEGDSQGYFFTIEASPEEVQKFYEDTMAELGWNIFASGQGTTSAIMLIFMKDSGTASVAIIPQSGGLVYVMLVK